jgi:hypothetical protein
MQFIVSERLLVLFVPPPIIWIVSVVKSCHDCDNRDIPPTDDLVEQRPVGPGILLDSSSHTIDQQADAVEAPNERIEFLDCFPVRNTALVAFIETGCIVDTKWGPSYRHVVGFTLEGAASGIVRHGGDRIAYNQVYDGTLPAA